MFSGTGRATAGAWRGSHICEVMVPLVASVRLGGTRRQVDAPRVMSRRRHALLADGVR